MKTTTYYTYDRDGKLVHFEAQPWGKTGAIKAQGMVRNLGYCTIFHAFHARKFRTSPTAARDIRKAELEETILALKEDIDKAKAAIAALPKGTLDKRNSTPVEIL
jgi:hypothetical protein